MCHSRPPILYFFALFMQLLNGFCVQINVDVYEVKRPLMFIPPNAKDCFEVNGIIWRVTSLHHCTSTSAALVREPPTRRWCPQSFGDHTVTFAIQNMTFPRGHKRFIQSTQGVRTFTYGGVSRVMDTLLCTNQQRQYCSHKTSRSASG